MHRWLKALGMVALMVAMLGLSACAFWPHADEPPLLRLAPASLGRELSVVQRMDVQAAGQTRSLDVALEADADAVRLAVMQLGHTVARLAWDGRDLQQSLAPGWPKVVSAERVLSDLQLVWWPLEVLQQALPEGWRLTQSSLVRELRHGDKLVTSARIVAPGHVELIQSAGYTVQVHSIGADPVFTPTTVKSP
jgi:hypothetical protein